MDTKQLCVDVIARMRAVVDAKSDIELSAYFGGSKTLMSNKKQRGSVPYDEAVQLAIDKGISLDWLILGRGPAPSDSYVDVPVMTSLKLSEPGRACELDDEFVSIPAYDIQAAAGAGRLFDAERIKHYVKFRRDWLASEGLYPKDLVAVDVIGDSMFPTLHDKDTVLVNRALRNGDGVFLLRMGDALRIKRVQRLSDGSLRLSSDNEMYAPEVIHLEQREQVEILGLCHARSGKIH